MCQFLAMINLKFDVIILSEIWSTNLEFYCNILPGYDFVYEIPANGIVGGIGMFINNCCVFHELPQFKLHCSNVEDIWLEVVKNQSKYIIGGIYRHPNHSVCDFSSTLDDTMSKLSNQKLPCIVAGDLNIDLTKCSTNKNTADYVNSVLANNFIPTILMPTRITANSATLIDHIYYFPGKSKLETKSGNFLTEITDHLPNYLLLYNMKHQNYQYRPLTRIISNKNVNKFKSDLDKTDWTQLLATNDPNIAYNEFSSTLSTLFNNNFPLIKKSRKCVRDKPWITNALKKSSRLKYKLYKKWLQTGSKLDETAYKDYKRVYIRISKEAESIYYQQLFNNKENSLKKLWNNLNTVCSFKKKNTSVNITKINVNSKDITDPSQICNEFNNYFCTIGDSLVSKLPSTDGCRANFLGYCNPSLLSSMVCDSVDQHELLALIATLDNSKSPGHDNIGARLIKEVKHYIVEPLLHIINLSFSNGVFPDRLKIAKVVPIYKKEDRSLMSNYRPISLLSVFSKLIERLMHKRLYSFLTKNNILYRYQFGFRKNFSTTLALIEVIDNLIQNMESDNISVGIYLDLQKAFDTVNHKILLAKMNNYGIRGNVYNWFSSYLTNRKQYTAIGHNQSKLGNITCGVPQGSVLGPLLFILYVNDIHNAVPDVNIRLFADDTNLFMHDNNYKSLMQIANDNLSKLNEWFIVNRLSLNLNKTCYSIFSNSKINDCNIVINDVEIKRVKSCKYLGVIIDDELRFDTHIDHVYSKLIKFVSIFYKLSYKLPYHCLRSIYFAFINSHIAYGIEIYANTSKKSLHKLHILNNKLLRILQKQPLLTPVSQLYSNFCILPINLLYKQKILELVHSSLFHVNTLPDVYHNYFTVNRSVHSHDTRQRNDLHILYIKKSFGMRSVQHTGSVLWNTLSSMLKECMSKKTFKKKLKKYLLSEMVAR